MSAAPKLAEHTNSHVNSFTAFSKLAVLILAF